jgi:hypothetical protein
VWIEQQDWQQQRADANNLTVEPSGRTDHNGTRIRWRRVLITIDPFHDLGRTIRRARNARADPASSPAHK